MGRVLVNKESTDEKYAVIHSGVQEIFNSGKNTEWNFIKRGFASPVLDRMGDKARGLCSEQS